VPDTKINLQGSSKLLMDYLNVGANGFAQVGDEHYFAKSKVEMQYLLKLISDKFPIPAKLSFLCFFGIKSFPHDFGTYHEIVLHFDDIAIGDGYDEDDDENECELHDLFWEWFHTVESFNVETEEITEVIRSNYLGTLDISKGKHLTVKRA
jgi:hypothetical protein